MLSQPRAAEPVELEPVVLRAAQVGDRHAQRMLVVLHQDRVFRLLRRVVAPSGLGDAVIEDLAQDTFVRVFDALPRFDPHGAARLSTWILTFATRLAIDALREGARNIVTLDADATADDRSRLGDVEDGWRGAALQRAMAKLAPEQRAVFVLREYHGLDYEEIACALDLKPGTVASRLARARESLERALGGGS